MINITLKKINLSGNDITNEGARFILDALKINTNLKELYIKYNNIADNLEIAISDSLKRNRLIDLSK